MPAETVGIGLQPSDQFRQIIRRQSLLAKNDRIGPTAPRCEIVQHVVGKVERAVQDMRVKMPRTIINRPACELMADADAAVRPDDVFNDDRLADQTSHVFDHDPRDRIRAPPATNGTIV